MGIFQPVIIGWNGEDFTIPANKVLGAIAVVEELVTFPELVAMMESGRPRLLLIARAYAGVLRYAGATVTDEETYAGMFNGTQQQQIAEAINALLVMMVPPSAMAEPQGKLKAAAGNLKAAGSGRSKPSTRRR
jgi:hypothetical protein